MRGQGIYVRQIILGLLVCLALTTCTVGIVRREELTPDAPTTPTPGAIPTDASLPVPTDTPEPSPTPSPLPSDTPTPAPTAAPIPLATATETPSPDPVIRYFRSDVEEVDPGGTIVLEWETVGASEATISHHSPNAHVIKASWAVDVTGDYAYEIDPSEYNHIYLQLDVRNEAGRSASASITVKLHCHDPWFFSPEPYSCPTAPVLSDAAEQHFEHGTMIWIEEKWAGGDSGESRVLVLYDDAQFGPKWAVYLDEWNEGEPDRDPTLTPPAGLYQPMRGFGLVWRQNSDVRSRLGWAIDQETGFSTIIQGTMLFKYNSTYLRALDGNVWHLLAERSGWEKISVEN